MKHEWSPPNDGRRIMRFRCEECSEDFELRLCPEHVERDAEHLGRFMRRHGGIWVDGRAAVFAQCGFEAVILESPDSDFSHTPHFPNPDDEYRPLIHNTLYEGPPANCGVLQGVDTEEMADKHGAISGAALAGHAGPIDAREDGGF